MKIPNASEIDWTYMERMKAVWEDAAFQLSLESGVFIEVVTKSDESYLVTPIKEITFKVGEHEFESLAALKTAINNKAFL